FSKEQVYDVVRDVNHYKDFLPHCEESSIFDIKEATAKGTMTISFFGIKENFESSIKFERPNYVKSSSIGGIFDCLDAEWEFLDPPSNKGDFSNVHFKSRCIIKSPIYYSILALNLQLISEMLVFSFEKRCIRVYNSKTSQR
ncbi:hypothetical protein MXB_2580, partial [Myxobolus squamalis]